MRGAGSAIFVATLLLIVGTVNTIYGIGAVANSAFWVDGTQYVFGNVNTWGWATLVIGAIQLVAGLSLLAGGTFGRVIGIAAASLGAIVSLLAIGGTSPFWALGAFAICIICIHGLVVLGEPLED